MNHVEIVTTSDDKLSEELWRFYITQDLNKCEVRLSAYLKKSRPSTRHKMKVVDRWDRLMKRICTIEHPKIPVSVASRAIQEARLNLRFCPRTQKMIE